MNPVVDFIETVPLFEGMSGLELNAVSAFLEPRRYKAGAVICRQGDRGGELLIVKVGRAGSVSSNPLSPVGEESEGQRIREETGEKHPLSPDGSNKGWQSAAQAVVEYGPKRFIGEIALVEGEPQPSTIVALEDCELYALDGIDFFRLVWELPMIGVRLLSNMGREMAAALNRRSVFLDDLMRWGESARRRAITDQLSGLFNRRFLDEAVALRLARGDYATRPCAVLMLDVDHFRDINDRYGHEAGDAVIANVGASIGRSLREGDIAARLSGDEFAFLLAHADTEEAGMAAERVRKLIADLYLEFRPGAGNKPERVRISASLGVSSWPRNGLSARELFETADEALGRAKREGRNRVVKAGE